MFTDKKTVTQAFHGRSKHMALEALDPDIGVRE